MKSFMIVACIFLLFGLSAGASNAPTPHPKADEATLVEAEKNREELLNVLLSNPSLSLKGRKFCETFVANGRGNVGKFISRSLSFFQEGQANSITGQCDSRESKATCKVEFLADSKGESPWFCGLKFKLNRKTSKIDPATLECTGSC